VERFAKADRAATLATAVAHDLNDELTVILSSLNADLAPGDKLLAVERASLRCALISRRLLAYAQRRGVVRAQVALAAFLEQDAA
jgi:hypothetical protein